MTMHFPLVSRLVFAALMLVMFAGCASQRPYDFTYVPTYEHDLIADIEGRRQAAMYDSAHYERDNMRIVGQRRHYSQPRAVIYDSTITTGTYTTYPYYSPSVVYYSNGYYSNSSCNYDTRYYGGHSGGHYNHYGHGGLHFNSHHGHGHFGSGGSHIRGHFGGNPSVHFNFGSGGSYCP